jgi:hypothetical protein
VKSNMRRVVLLLSLLPLVSCATVTTGTTEGIAIGSSPPGANATMVCNGKPAGSGVTPTTITIHRNAGDCNVRVSKDGFEDAMVSIEQGVNPAYWANMAFSPLAPAGVYLVWLGNSSEKTQGATMIGAAVVVFATDFWTGAVHAHRPNRIDVSLRPKP